LNSCSDNLKSKIQKRPRRLKWVGLSVIAFVLVMSGNVAHAQQPTKVPRIGFLDPSNASGSAVLLDALQQEMRMARQLRVEFEGALDSSNHPSLLQFDIPIDRR